ncbi:hypothetical protein Sp245p_31515 (plasmid) [Azospirillum baldaniorum]|uniref:Uncharacterized protein n=1 Tax=Azospirillum baldaniorum TaxID=1064539 RepID=A0A9P1K1H8_9PROT|nr:hypothetical protein [Azospirillum baldaniorum]AWJ94386.1 hypothetical protein Sp245p_31515 [Azospirillum baldaniorum]TWA70439.1 hypothetical protein FBZ85_12358 [Azospirillum brasilense]CCD03842.1 protein of unknown function [Azospirillum baldaniorum]
MPKILDFAAARDTLIGRRAECLPPSSLWQGRIISLPDGVSDKPMPQDDAAQAVAAFRDGFLEATKSAECAVDGFLLDARECLRWDMLLAPLAVAACGIVRDIPGMADLAVEVFPAPDALTGWGVRGLRGPRSMLHAAAFAVAAASRLPGHAEVFLDRAAETFGVVLKAHGLPSEALVDLGGRLLTWPPRPKPVPR